MKTFEVRVIKDSDGEDRIRIYHFGDLKKDFLVSGLSPDYLQNLLIQSFELGKEIGYEYGFNDGHSDYD